MEVAHNLPILTTLVGALSAAFLGGMIASKLKLSPICGYLMAGIAIGAYTPGFVADPRITEELSEIGIVLMMFGVGLHFSLQDLLKVRHIALPGALTQMAVAIGMGAALANWWGWRWESGLMLGLALSVASTVVLLRALKENGLINSEEGHIAIGWLIVEDIALILALVMIPILATMEESTSVGVAVQAVGFALLKVVVFVALMLLVGKRVLPWLLQAVKDTRSNELFTLAIFSIAVGVSFGAAKLFGISLALGAFFAGMVIHESDYTKEVEKRALPFQDIFAVLFFVSVGMLFNPHILVDRPLDVLAVVAIILVGKSLAALLIISLFEHTVKSGLVIAAGLSQIGEFSFILAGIGLSYGLLPVDARSLIVAGALISIALNPIMFRLLPLIYGQMTAHPIERRGEDERRYVERRKLKRRVIVEKGP